MTEPFDSKDRVLAKRLEELKQELEPADQEGWDEAPEGMQRAELGPRVVAGLIDGGVAGLANGLLSLIPFIGPLLGTLAALSYWLFRDVTVVEDDEVKPLSLGKRAMGLEAVEVDDPDGKVSPGTSLLRNSILCVGYLGTAFTMIPFVGWILALLFGVGGVGLTLFELYNVTTRGYRLGDVWAGTDVIDVGNPAIPLDFGDPPDQLEE